MARDDTIEREKEFERAREREREREREHDQIRFGVAFVHDAGAPYIGSNIDAAGLEE
jgi:hypothetical protein